MKLKIKLICPPLSNISTQNVKLGQNNDNKYLHSKTGRMRKKEKKKKKLEEWEKQISHWSMEILNNLTASIEE